MSKRESVKYCKLCVFIQMRHEKPYNKKCWAFRSKFVSYKISGFLGKECLFVMQETSYSWKLTVAIVLQVMS